MHHLISDGVSISIMLKELADIYVGNQPPELRIQYKDYAVWQAERAKEGYKKERAYWKEVFSGELPVLQALPDYPRPQVQSFEGDRVSAKAPKIFAGTSAEACREKRSHPLHGAVISILYSAF